MPCHASIKTWTSGFHDELDIILFNHEPHWHLLDRFVNARHRVFYALHYSHAYEKAGSWECLRTPVDLQLANSNWTADQIFAEIGSRPTVQLGGANREVFRPHGGPKRYPILCTGGDEPQRGAGRQPDFERIVGHVVLELTRRYGAPTIGCIRFSTAVNRPLRQLGVHSCRSDCIRSLPALSRRWPSR